MRESIFCLFLSIALLLFAFIRPHEAFADLGYGRCAHCKKTWRVVEGHTIPYCDPKDGARIDGVPWVCDPTNRETWHSGMFPVCQKCFLKLPKERVKQYAAELVSGWNRDKETVLKTAFESIDLEKP